jgi:hypothetical protein
VRQAFIPTELPAHAIWVTDCFAVTLFVGFDGLGEKEFIESVWRLL